VKIFPNRRGFCLKPFRFLIDKMRGGKREISTKNNRFNAFGVDIGNEKKAFDYALTHKKGTPRQHPRKCDK
jgi:hypothetical protein